MQRPRYRRVTNCKAKRRQTGYQDAYSIGPVWRSVSAGLRREGCGSPTPLMVVAVGSRTHILASVEPLSCLSPPNPSIRRSSSPTFWPIQSLPSTRIGCSSPSTADKPSTKKEFAVGRPGIVGKSVGEVYRHSVEDKWWLIKLRNSSKGRS